MKVRLREMSPLGDPKALELSRPQVLTTKRDIHTMGDSTPPSVVSVRSPEASEQVEAALKLRI